eukprot:1030866-Pelagomonas_calceolata.AAC.1
MCSAWSNNRTFLQQTMPRSCMQALSAPCKLLLPFIAYVFSLDNQQQTRHKRLLHPHTTAGFCPLNRKPPKLDSSGNFFAGSACQVLGWMVVILAQSKNNRAKNFYSSSHSLLRLHDTTGLPRTFSLEGGQSFRAGVR